MSPALAELPGASSEKHPQGHLASELRTQRAVCILLLGAGFETGNMGVSALAGGAAAAIWTAFPQAIITLLDYGKGPATYGFARNGSAAEARLLPLRYSKNCFQPNNVLHLCFLAVLARLLPRVLGRRLVRRNPWLRAVSEADAIGALSGGDSFSDLYGINRLLYVSLPQILVLLLQRPLVLLPQTYGPFRSAIGRVLAKWILRRALRIYSRDHAGMAFVRSLPGMSAARPRFAFDLAFALEPLAPAAEAQPLASGSVGLNVSGLLYSGIGVLGKRAPSPGAYAQILSELVHFFVTQLGREVALVPHVFGESEESDVLAARHFRQTLPPPWRQHVRLLAPPPDPRQVKHLIGRCDFFVGSRMHACIAALSQGIPAVALAYSDKFAGVYEPLEMGSLVVDLRRTPAAEAVAQVKAAWLERQQLARKLQDVLPPIRSQAVGLFRDVIEATEREGCLLNSRLV